MATAITKDNIYVGKRIIPIVSKYKECGWVIHIDAATSIVKLLFSDGNITDITFSELDSCFAEDKAWEDYVAASIKADIPIMPLTRILRVRIQKLESAILLIS